MANLKIKISILAYHDRTIHTWAFTIALEASGARFQTQQLTGRWLLLPAKTIFNYLYTK